MAGFYISHVRRFSAYSRKSHKPQSGKPGQRRCQMLATLAKMKHGRGQFIPLCSRSAWRGELFRPVPVFWVQGLFRSNADIGKVRTSSITAGSPG
jgi:hypothetical protein